MTYRLFENMWQDVGVHNSDFLLWRLGQKYSPYRSKYNNMKHKYVPNSEAVCAKCNVVIEYH